MKDKTTRGRNQDYEVNYEKKKMGVGTDKVKDAVDSVGNSRKKVEKKLRK